MTFSLRRAASLVAVLLGGTLVTNAENFLVEQKNMTFVYQGAPAKTLQLKLGDTIEFKNADTYFHNVFSLSDSKLFDLGSYPQGQSRSVTFDKPGRVEVECAIHPHMKMIVEVK
jgi:plastocyanin